MADEKIKEILKENFEALTSSGIEFTKEKHSVNFFQQDDEVLFSKSFLEGLEILEIEKALKDSEVKNYLGKGFKILNKDYPTDICGGYFIRVKKSITVEIPIQACLFLKKRGFKQKVHNIVIVEEDAKVYIITGCVASQSSKESFHLGISEFFIKKGGYLNFTMIHSWHKDVKVRPISVAVVEEGGNFVSNYICLKPVKEVVMYPTAVLKGRNSKASFNSLIMSHSDSYQDIGARVILKEANTQAEIISRSVSLGGKIVMRGHLKAESKDVKAHLECRGLVLSDKGSIHAIPELETRFKDVNLSHEAAIGKISKDEIEYLRSKGFNEKQAQSLIIRGFMDVDILGLPEFLKKEIKNIEENILKESF